MEKAKSPWSLRVLQGIFIGSGAVLPGISGGMLTVIFGLYADLMAFLAHPLQQFKRLGSYLLPVLIGWVFGAVAFAYIMERFFSGAEDLALWLFVGLILGSFPALTREGAREGRGKGAWLSLCVGFALMLALLLMLLLTQNTYIPANTGWYIVCGALWGLGMVVPGLSPSAILVFLGLYQQMIAALSSFDLPALLPVLIGILGIIPFARLINLLFARHYAVSFHAIIGIVAASTVMIVPAFRSLPQLLLGLALCLIGAVICFGIDNWGGVEKPPLRHYLTDPKKLRAAALALALVLFVALVKSWLI